MLKPIHLLWKDMNPEQQAQQKAYDAEQEMLWEQQNEQYEIGDPEYFDY